MIKAPTRYNFITGKCSVRHDETQDLDWFSIARKERSTFRLVTERNTDYGIAARRIAWDATQHRLVTRSEFQFGVSCSVNEREQGIWSSCTDPLDYDYYGSHGKLYATNGLYYPLNGYGPISRPFLRNGKYFSIFEVRPITEPANYSTPRELYMLSWVIQDPPRGLSNLVGGDGFKYSSRPPDLVEVCNSPQFERSAIELHDVIQLPNGRILLSAHHQYRAYLGYHIYDYNLIVLDADGHYITRSTIYGERSWSDHYEEWEFRATSLMYPTLLSDGSVSFALSTLTGGANYFFASVSEEGAELWRTPPSSESDNDFFFASARTSDGRMLFYRVDTDAEPDHTARMILSAHGSILATRDLGAWSVHPGPYWCSCVYSEATQYWYVFVYTSGLGHLDIYRTRTLTDWTLWRSCEVTDFPGFEWALSGTHFVWYPNANNVYTCRGNWCTDDGRAMYIVVGGYDAAEEVLVQRIFLMELDDPTKPLHFVYLHHFDAWYNPTAYNHPFVRSRGCLQA